MLAVVPLAAVWLGNPFVQPRGFARDLSVAFGYLAFALLLLQFALVSRLGPVSRPFGADALMQWHRGVGFVALLLVVAHPLLLPGVSWNPLSGPTALQTGAIALWATVLIVLTSVGRRRLRLSYEVWQVLHLLLACAVAGTAAWHVLAIGGYSSTAAVRWTIAGYLALFAGLLVRYRMVRPLRLLSRPWCVVSNERIGYRTRLLRVRPVDHDGVRFLPGQFAWLVTGRSPLWSGQHPLSIASSATMDQAGAIEFAVKALGDWSEMTVPTLRPGGRVWVDGAYGGFTPAPDATDGLVLLAGGIGIAPMRSILLTLRDRGEERPIWLFYAAADWTRIVFREEIEALERDLNLRVCFVLERPDADGSAERGYLTREILERYLPDDRTGFDYFVCGPVPMMDAVEGALRSLGVPNARIHTERFQMV
ncbi:MAG TPA: ferredoxin reductase family protein [Vicinamibacterales bacterium]|nr:ferredoxin reductase family protein [Vicinamibacterales bacterium]